MPRELTAYGKFLGLDTVTSKDNMSERYQVTLERAYADFRGQINKAGGLKPLMVAANSQNVVVYKKGEYIDWRYDGANLDAVSSTGITLDNAFTGRPAVAFTQFTRNLWAFAYNQQPVYYSGTAFARSTVAPMGDTAVAIMNRLAVANIPSKPTEVHLCKMDDAATWTTSTATPAAATDPAVIDVQNQLTSRDSIKGLGVLEGDKLAIFCENETIIYSASTDIRQYAIVRDFRVPIGVFGKKTIKPVGTDLVFCSRFGIHLLRRAASGLTLETVSLSRVVQSLYDDLVANVPSGEEPRGVWSPALGQYSVFFPQTRNGTTEWDRLVFTYEPGSGRGGFQSYSYAPNVGIADGWHSVGDVIAGHVSQGLCQLDAEGYAVSMKIKTPMLWQGNPELVKQYRRLFVRIQGNAEFTVTAYNESGATLQTTTHQLAADEPEDRPIDIPFRHRCRGVQLEFTSTDANPLKILDFAIQTGG